MAGWWESMTQLQHIFLYAAFPFTLVLIIQAVLTFIGIGGGSDSDSDADADTDGGFEAHDMGADHDADFDSHAEVHEAAADETPGIAGFRFFTIRGLVAFFCIFGWAGFALCDTTLGTLPILLIATAAGLLAMLVIGLMFYAVKRMQSSGNLRYSNAVGKSAEVYIPVPGQRSGRGKVMVLIQERLVEAEAVTDEADKLKTGETVRVTGNLGSTLIVNR